MQSVRLLFTDCLNPWESLGTDELNVCCCRRTTGTTSAAGTEPETELGGEGGNSNQRRQVS